MNFEKEGKKELRGCCEVECKSCVLIAFEQGQVVKGNEKKGFCASSLTKVKVEKFPELVYYLEEEEREESIPQNFGSSYDTIFRLRAELLLLLPLPCESYLFPFLHLCSFF